MNLSESYIKRIQELAGIQEQVAFDNSFIGYHHGQHDAVLNIYNNGIHVGSTSYSVFEGRPHIDYINVSPNYKRQGYGEKMIDYLAKEYGYENILWGMTTEDGGHLMKKMDAKYSFDRSQILIKQFTAEEIFNKISSKLAVNFLKDLIELGASITFEKWRDKLPYNNLIDGIDVNDLSSIAEWIIGAKDNHNPADYEPPDYVIGLVNQLEIQESLNENNNSDYWINGGIILLKGEPDANGVQKMFATHILNLKQLDRTKKDNSIGKPAMMAILGGDVYRLLVKQGELQSFKIDWSREPSLSKVLKLSPHKSHSVVLNNNKTPYHWETLKFNNMAAMLRGLSSTILSIPNINWG